MLWLWSSTHYQGKRTLETASLGEAKSAWDSSSADSTAEYNAGPSRIVSEHIVQRTLLYMGLCSRCSTHVPRLTKIIPNYAYTGPGTLWLDHGSAGESYMVRWILIRHSSHWLPRQGTLSSMQTVAPPIYSKSYTTGGGSIILWRMFSWAYLAPMVVLEQTMKAAEHHLEPVASLHGVFQKYNAPSYKARIVLEWFQEHNAKFQWMFWPDLSLDLYQMEHILGCRGTFSSELKKLPCSNIWIVLWAIKWS